MNAQQRNQIKRILVDPVAEYRQLFADSREGEIAKLKELTEQHRTQKKQHKEIKNQSRLISKKIGEAKQAGLPIEELKARMQQQSAEAKAASKRLNDTESRILEFFNLSAGDTNDEDPIGSLKQRKYPGTAEISGDVSIALLGSELDEWNHYVENNPAASLYHRAEWRQLIHDTFGHEGLYYVARDNKRNIVGILPLIRLKSRMFGDFQVSMPYFNYGGAVGDHPLIEQKLMAAADEDAARRGVSHIEYRDDISRSAMPARTEKVNMILPLPGEESELWNSFAPKLRAQIRRPQRENPQVYFNESTALDEFYSVFSRNMRDLGTPVYSKSFFCSILDYFTKQSHIIVIKLDHRPVAAAFLLGHGDTLEIPWASTIREVNHYSINMLLYWEVLRFAIKKRYVYFDFGRSSKGTGTYRFKQQWGAQPKPLYWHYWLKNGGDLPSLNPSNPKYALMINIWKRLPIPITNLIGPMVVKNLP